MANKIGRLLVITGASGSGKDAVMDGVLEHEYIKRLDFKKIVTCTDRPPRPGEIDGVHHHFVSYKKLKIMAKRGELVEEITSTGTSNKATPKNEILRFLNGGDLIWRINPSRAADVAEGKFFENNFPEHAEALKSNTLVIYVHTPGEIIEKRRKKRDGKKYNPQEYAKRDRQEAPHLHVLMEKAVVIKNFDGKLQETVTKTLELIKLHYAKK